MGLRRVEVAPLPHVRDPQRSAKGSDLSGGGPVVSVPPQKVLLKGGVEWALSPPQMVLRVPLAVTLRDKLRLPLGVEAMGVTLPSEEVVRSRQV